MPLLTPPRVASRGVEGRQRMGVEGSQSVEVRPTEGFRRRRDVEIQRGGAAIDVVVVVNTDRPGVVGPGASGGPRETGRPSGARAAGVVGAGGAGGWAGGGGESASIVERC